MRIPDSDTIWEAIAMLCVVSIAAIILVAIVSTKKIDGYYLSTSDNVTSKTCLYVDVEWAIDWKAFCTDDVPFAIESAKQLNATLK